MKNENIKNSNYLLLLKVIIIIFALVVIAFIVKLNNIKHINEKLVDQNMNYIEKHGRLSVKGTELVDEHENTFVLRGLSSHGLAWYPEFVNYRSLKTIKDYGANVFRIAMYVDQNDGYLEEPELNEKLLYSAIEDSLAVGIYTIVDWHVLKDENPMNNVEKAVSMFEKIAKKYGDEPGIIYEICNEPNGDTTYEDIVKYADRVIPVIRKYAPNAIILIGTPKFCTSLEGVMENPIKGSNLMYTYHFYAGLSDCKNAIKKISDALERGIPIFISEWGIDGDTATEENLQDTKDFLDFLSQKHVSWINWSLSNKEEGYSFVSHKTDKLHNWTEDELTFSGRFVLEYFKDKN